MEIVIKVILKAGVI